MTEMIPFERERTRVNKREIMTRPRPTFARTRPRTFTYSQRTADRVRRSSTRDFSGSVTESEGATRDARRISEEREKLACGTEVARESGPEARCSSVDDSSLPWGARAAQPYSLHARVHADARVCGASRHQRGAIRSVCPCPLGDLEMCVMKNARIIAGHSSVRRGMMRAYCKSRLEDAVSRLLSATSTECIEFFRRYEIFRAMRSTAMNLY